MYKANDFETVIYNSPWKNAYWFTRNLLNTDKYGAIGKDEKLMQAILSETSAILMQPLSDADKLNVCMNITTEKIKATIKKGTKAEEYRTNFISYLSDEIQTLQDFIVLIVNV